MPTSTEIPVVLATRDPNLGNGNGGGDAPDNEVEIHIEITAQVTITNREWSAEVQNPESDQYQEIYNSVSSMNV